MILEVEHQGYQARALWAGLKGDSAQGEAHPTYANRFTAIASDLQFRPERNTPKPKLHGTINAVVDAAGDGKHAELDDQGRYKVILPFDQSGNKDGKASRYVRMAQPYSGAEYGMHFPLHKGAEVLLTFVDGDPDRPIISATAPNPEHTSPVTSANQTKSVVRDDFGNEIIFDATPGDEHIRLYSPHHNSGLEIGKSVKQWTTSDSEDWTVGNAIEGHAGTKTEFCAGFVSEWSLASSIEAFAGSKHELFFGAGHEWIFGYQWDYVLGPTRSQTISDSLLTARHDVIFGAGDEFCLAAGTQEPDEGISNKSVMRATPDGVTLSIGPELTECGEGVGAGDWYEKESLLEALFGTGEAMALASLGAGFLAGGATAGSIAAGLGIPPGKGNAPLSIAVGEIALILAITSIVADIALGVDELSDKKIEPVNHVDPGAKIWLYREGTAGMVSTKGENDQTSGDKGRVVVGVNEQKPTRKDNWQFYDKYDKHDAAGDIYKSLGQGSNMIVEKSNIKLRSGDPIDDEDEAKRQIVTIGEYANNKNGIEIAAGQSSITIERDNKITIESKKDIKMSSASTFIKGDNSISLSCPRGNIVARGAVEHKNFKILA